MSSFTESNPNVATNMVDKYAVDPKDIYFTKQENADDFIGDMTKCIAKSNPDLDVNTITKCLEGAHKYGQKVFGDYVSTLETAEYTV